MSGSAFPGRVKYFDTYFPASSKPMTVFLNLLFSGIGLFLLVIGWNAGSKHLLIWSFMIPVLGVFLAAAIRQADQSEPPAFAVLLVLLILATFVWEAYLLDAGALKVTAGFFWGVWLLVGAAQAIRWIGERLPARRRGGYAPPRATTPEDRQGRAE